MIRIALILAIAACVFVARAQALNPAPPLKSQFGYEAKACFHVAPKQWVCPMAAPRKR